MTFNLSNLIKGHYVAGHLIATVSRGDNVVVMSSRNGSMHEVWISPHQPEVDEARAAVQVCGFIKNVITGLRNNDAFMSHMDGAELQAFATAQLEYLRMESRWREQHAYLEKRKEVA